MAVICPTITASEDSEYSKQIDNVKDFVSRIHIDLMDGLLAPTKSVALDKVYWPDNLIADIHLMYQKPMDYLEQLLKLKPNMVIMHKEADVEHAHFAQHLRDNGVKSGIAILQDTSVDSLKSILSCFDQVLVFSGNLGYQGGQADLNLLSKVHELKTLSPSIEIAWDGGINADNAKQLVEAGVDVLNVGGFIQRSDNPKDAYDKLLSSL